MSALRALAERERRYLQQFQETPPLELMVRLVHTECLLELAKLSSIDMELATYADTVTAVLEQFLPLRWASLRLELAGVPVIHAERGRPPDGDVEGVRSDLVVGEYGKGWLSLALDVQELAPQEFVDAVAEQLSSGLTAVAEAERVRRQAALFDTARIISSLTEEPTGEDFQTLVEAVSYLPNVLGATLRVEHSTVGGSLVVSAGLRGQYCMPTEVVPGGALDLAVAWAGDPSFEDVNTLQDALGQLGSALARAEERRRLMAEAQTDPLTGVANRRKGIQTLVSTLHLAEPNEDYVAVAFFDLDQFKQVNDRFGHAVGDDVLVRFAAHLSHSVRRSDTVARLGGEEFLVICPGLGERAGASLCESIVMRTPQSCASESAPGWVQRTSAGLAVFPLAGRSPEDLMRAADMALYAAKGLGGSQVMVAGPMD